MSGPPDRLDDDLLERQLRRRAAKGQLTSADRERLIAAATATQVTRPASPRWSFFSAPIAAALMVALVAGVVIVGSIPSGPAAPPAETRTASGSISATPLASVAPRLEGLRVLAPEEVEAALSAPRDAMRERVVVADVTVHIGPESLSPCHFNGVCLIGRLGLPGGRLPIYAAEEVRVGLARGELAGWAALSISSSLGGPRLTFLGAVQPGSPGLSSTVPDVLARADEIGVGELLVVEGWLVSGGDGSIRCGRPDDDPMDGPFRCEPTDWIAESPDDPVIADDGSGWLRMPGPALTVQPYAAGTFSEYDPDAKGPPEPRRGAFLGRATEDVGVDCGGCQQWRILGRIDPVGPPEPAEAPEPGPTLSPLVLRAEAAVPDSNVPTAETRSLVSTTRRWFIVAPGSAGGPGLVDRPMAAASVDVDGDRASIEFHDYGDGRAFLALLRVAAGEAVSLDIVTALEADETALSAWEKDEASRLALEGTQVGSFGGTFARDVAVVPCPARTGWCARVELVTDEFADPPIPVADVIVDIGREEVVAEYQPGTDTLAPSP